MRWIGFILLPLLLGACATQTRVVHDNSVGAKFAEFNRQGWQVTRNDQPTQVKKTNPNVNVLRESTFNLKFNTNFTIDDPMHPELNTNPPVSPDSQGAASQPAADPWITMPVPMPPMQPIPGKSP